MDTIDQVRTFLVNSGYSNAISDDRSTCIAIHDLNLAKNLNGWCVFATERGSSVKTFLHNVDGREAIGFFLRMVSSMTYHIKSSRDEKEVSELESLLRASNVPFHRNDVPYDGWFRVFVLGSDLIRAQHIAATLDQ